MRRQQDRQLDAQVERIFQANRQIYSSPRLVDALRKQGICCGENRVRRLMKEQGLRAAHKRRRQPRTTNSEHALPVAPNLLRDKPAPKTVNLQWVSDITYIATREGWLYLAGTLDCYSRRLVGWQTSASLESEVVLSAARRAFENRRPTSGLVYHSDRGSQYASRVCQRLLAQQGAQQSMSRRGNCYDNAMMEYPGAPQAEATLKTECFGDLIPATRAQARTMLFDYIEVVYNRKPKLTCPRYRSNFMLARQSLKERTESQQKLEGQVAEWQNQCKAAKVQVEWHCGVQDARCKLKPLYPRLLPS